jgi:uncharacterized membrane protein
MGSFPEGFARPIAWAAAQEGERPTSDHRLLVGAIVLALIASVCFNMGLAIQKRAALTLPHFKWPLMDALRSFVVHRGWLAGNLLVALGWCLQFVAFLFAPVGVVLPAVAAGVGLQAWLAQRWFNEKLHPSEWAGVAACSLGVLLVALSVDPHHDASSRFMHGGVLTCSVGALAALAALALWLARHGRWREGALATAAGLLYATTGLLTKALSITSFHDRSPGLSLGLVVLLAGISVAALLVAQAAYQRGRSMVVVPVMGALADFVPVALSPSVFSEGWPHGYHSLVRIFGFAFILCGLWLLARPESVDTWLEQELEKLEEKT